MKKIVVFLCVLILVSSFSFPCFAEKSEEFKLPEDGLKSDGKIHVYIIGEGEKVLTPESSFIRYITYYPVSNHLIINMNGKDYAFSNVKDSLWEDFKDAESKGSFYNKYIKGKSTYLIKDYSSGDGNKIVVEYISVADENTEAFLEGLKEPKGRRGGYYPPLPKAPSLKREA